MFVNDVPKDVCCVSAQERDAGAVEGIICGKVLGGFGWVCWLGWWQSACDDASLIVVLDAWVAPRVRARAACPIVQGPRYAVRFVSASSGVVVGH